MSMIAPIAPPSIVLRFGDSLPARDFAPIRRRMVLDCCKWDPQVGDVSTIAPFPLLIDRGSWQELEELAERLTAELLAAEDELLHRPDLHRKLAVPWRIRQALRAADSLGATPAAVRVMRFDFHATAEGWRISEVNSDVPGGFAESSELTRLMQEQHPGTQTPGEPGAAWADAMAQRLCDDSGGGDIALISAAGFMEDHQVVSYLAYRLQQRGLRTHLASPMQIRWDAARRAHLHSSWYSGPVAAVVRFYQAEWLPHLPRHVQWQRYFAGSRTPIAHPGSTVLTESKRFPLVWEDLRTSMPTWRILLPETHDPRDAPWRRDEGWLLKTAYCNTGDTVSARELSTPRQWRAAAVSAWISPRHWVAQRRFEPIAVPSSLGDVFPCIGVYTINGRAAGAYTRISTRRVIDFRAIDAALLVTEALA